MEVKSEKRGRILASRNSPGLQQPGGGRFVVLLMNLNPDRLTNRDVKLA
jgi:hypothetical protein